MMLLLAALGSLSQSQTSSTWTPDSDDHFIYAGNYSDSSQFNMADATYIGGVTPIGILNPMPTNGSESICDCGGLGLPTWRREDDTSFDTRRCRRPRLGWTWTLSGPDTEAIVMTIPPGKKQDVKVGGSASQFLTSMNNELGQPCGVVTQDVFESARINPKSSPTSGPSLDVDLLPTTIPSSEYCAPQMGFSTTPIPAQPDVTTGSLWERGWAEFEIKTTWQIDRVCRCKPTSYNRLGAIFELSGVIFTTTNIEYIYSDTAIPNNAGLAEKSTRQTRQSDASTLTQAWEPTTDYTAPVKFECRDDYVLYWLLQIARTAAFDPSHKLNAVYQSPAMASISNTTLYAAGVDCQRHLSVGRLCSSNSAPANPFYLSGSHYFLTYNMTLMFLHLGITSKDNASSTALWRIAKNNPPTGTWNNQIDTDKVGEYYKPPGANNTIPSMFEFLVESTSLFVRLVMLLDHGETVSDLFTDWANAHIPDGIFEGAGCTEEMLSGENRQALNPIPSGKFCDSSLYDGNATAIQQDMDDICFDPSTATYFPPQNQNPGGACCNNQVQQIVPSCDAGQCGPCPCTDPSNPARGDCDGGFQPCSTSDHCDNTPYAGNPFVCCTRNNDYGNIQHCNCHIGVDDGDHPNCVRYTFTCVDDSSKPKPNGTNPYGNYVGGNKKLPPLDPSAALPRMRGVWFPPDPTVCTTPSAEKLGSSAQFNPCILGTPRPPLSSPLQQARTTTQRLYYPQQLFDTDIETVIANYGAPVWWRQGGADSQMKTIVYEYLLPGARNMWGGLYVNAISQQAVSCPLDDGDICTGQDYMNKMPTTADSQKMTNENLLGTEPTLVGTLTRYYTSLLPEVTTWLDTHTPTYPEPVNETLLNHFYQGKPTTPHNCYDNSTLEYCHGCGLFQSSTSVPSHWWPYYCGDDRQAPPWSRSRRYSLLLEQHVRDESSRRPKAYQTRPSWSAPTMMSTSSVQALASALEPAMKDIFHGDVPLCWTSRRGKVVDLDESPTGACVAADGELCYVMTKNGKTTSGCTVNDLTIPGTDFIVNQNTYDVTVPVDTFINWTLNQGNPGGPRPRCYHDPSTRICITNPATQNGELPSNFFQGPDELGEPGMLSESIGVSAPSTMMLSALCGCTSLVADTGDSIYRLADGSCDTTSTTGFNCTGYYLDEPIELHLCTNCTGNTLGQCQNASTMQCVGLDNSGVCPSNYDQCSNTYPVGYPPVATLMSTPPATTRGALTAIGVNGVGQRSNVPFDYYGQLYSNGNRKIHSVTDTTLNTIDDLASQIEYDHVNCVATSVTMGDKTHLTTLENPAFLATATPVPSATPQGLTEEALTSWCAGGSDCGPGEARHYLCERSAGSCTLRKASDLLYEIKEEGGGQTDSDVKSVPKFAPRCDRWVDGLDPDYYCQGHNAFTGCVITETETFTASALTEDGNTVYKDRTISSEATPLLNPQTFADCVTNCEFTTNCSLVVQNDSCNLYDSTAWDHLMYASDTNVTVLYGGSGGYLVPNVHGGPTNGAHPLLSGNIYLTANITFTLNTSCEENFNVIVYYWGIQTRTDATISKLNQTVSVNCDNNSSDLSIYVLGTPTEPYHQNGANLSPSQYRLVLRHTDLNNPVISFSQNGTTVEVTDYTINLADQNATTTIALTGRTRTCVPLTVRQVVSAATLEQDAKDYVVRRESPVNCADLSASAMQIDSSILADDGCCGSDQQLTWPPTTAPPTASSDINAQCRAKRNAGEYSNLRTFSRWYWAMSWGQSGRGQQLMMKPGGLGANASLFPSIKLHNPQSGTDDMLLPSCTDIEAGDCAIAVDRTGYVPCTGTEETSWFTCMNPLMTALYPGYPRDFSTEPTTPYLRPMKLYTTYQNIADFESVSDPEGILFYWQQYNTMNHYCSRWLGNNTLDFDGYDPTGKFVYCANDPLSYEDRDHFCTSKKPWWVLTGFTLDTLSLTDLCPFLDPGQQPDGRYCVVFADHPQFSTVRSMLSANIPSGATWAATTFYYAPFTLAQMRSMLLQPSAMNTLWTNSVDPGDLVDRPIAGKPVRLNVGNAAAYGSTIELFVRDALQSDALDDICDDTTAISLAAWRAIYAALQTYYNPATASYTLPSTDSTNPEDTVTVDGTPPIFREINTLIDYDDITLTSLVASAPARIGTKSSVVVNTIPVCTRYQVAGDRITLDNLVLDQSHCTLLDALRQTPVVFSGKSGAYGRVTGIHVIDSAVGVAVLGGDDLIYRSFGTTNANGLLIDRVSFEYTNGATPPMMQRTVAVFGRSTGVPVVASCPDAQLDPETNLIPNCYLNRSLDLGQHDRCGMPGECAKEDGCCGRPMNPPEFNLSCTFGIECPPSTKRQQIRMPNSAILCNAARCGCSTRFHQSSQCTVLTGDDCAYDAEKCHMACNDNIDAPQFYQNWQYNQSQAGEWYQIIPPPSTPTLVEVPAIGYGQLVWTVRPTPGVQPQTVADLQVEVHTLPITGLEPDLSPYALLTIVPESDCESCQIYDPNVKLRLFTEWFFAKGGLANVSREFLTSLQSTEWCVGVNQSNGNEIEMGRCGSDSFLDDWFFDGITTRMHVAGHPFMCPTLYKNTTTSRGSLDLAYAPFGGNLVWAPCLPCAIGAERLMLSDTANDYSQLLVFNQTHYRDATDTTTQWYPHNSTVNMSMSVVVEEDQRLGYLFDEDLRCYSTSRNGLEACDPEQMFPQTIEHLCATYNTSMYSGLFQYVCTQGYGGTIEHVALSPEECSNVGTGNLDGPPGRGGYGGEIDRHGTVLHAGIGYMNNEQIAVGSCTATITTSKVLMQPLTTSDAVDVATTNVEVVNLTAFTGFFGAAYEAQVNGQHLRAEGLLTTAAVVVWTLAITVVLLLVLLVFYEEELTEKVESEFES